ncbi:MAG TPA: lysine 5,6-aminomutase subunit alpha, partial [Blastococcus sp.]|nr:lysine 5,6-aminomutase subunit alpha [Blastococcus sp.]
MSTLSLDPALVARARQLAAQAAQPVIDLAHRHTTVSVERAVLRLAGLTGTDPVTGEGRLGDRVPWANRVVDAVRDQVGLEAGVALPVWHALASGGTLQQLAEDVGAGAARFEIPTGTAAERAREGARAAAAAGIARIDANRRRREELVATHGDPPRRPWIYLIVATGDIHEDIPQAQAAARDAVAGGIARIDANRRRREELVATHGDPPRRPWIYLIVATGDIYEDIPQAQAAARAGADVIAVIRSTGQSLLDYVPEGATRTGYAGTYATQENFRLMRAALDEVSSELGRYVRLTNYASGLCMPEIAVLAGLERLDMM